MTQRTDTEFIESIDACFPVTDRTAALELIRESESLSENAALMIACELACAGDQPSTLRLSLLEELTRTDRTALQAAAPLARSIIAGTEVLRSDVERLLELCRRHPGLYNGLCLLDLAAPHLEVEAEALRQSWRVGDSEGEPR